MRCVTSHSEDGCEGHFKSSRLRPTMSDLKSICWDIYLKHYSTFSWVLAFPYFLKNKLYRKFKQSKVIFENNKPYVECILFSLVLYMWNHATVILLCLVSFTYHNFFKVHSYCSMYQNFIPYSVMIMSELEAMHLQQCLLKFTSKKCKSCQRFFRTERLAALNKSKK